MIAWNYALSLPDENFNGMPWQYLQQQRVVQVADLNPAEKIAGDIERLHGHRFG